MGVLRAHTCALGCIVLNSCCCLLYFMYLLTACMQLYDKCMMELVGGFAVSGAWCPAGAVMYRLGLFVWLRHVVNAFAELHDELWKMISNKCMWFVRLVQCTTWWVAKMVSNKCDLYGILHASGRLVIHSWPAGIHRPRVIIPSCVTYLHASGRLVIHS